jgi:hypothetical protein
VGRRYFAADSLSKLMIVSKRVYLLGGSGACLEGPVISQARSKVHRTG